MTYQKQTPHLLRVQEQETVVPLRFQRAAKNNVELGRQRYLKTRKWREQYNMDTILSEPHVYFEFIKQHYPHYFHLFGRNGQPVYFEMPAQDQSASLASRWSHVGYTVEALCHGDGIYMAIHLKR